MKKTLLRGLSLFAACAMLLSLCACGGKSDNRGKTSKDGITTWYLGGGDLFSPDITAESLLKDYANTIDPAAIYNSTAYTAAMLHGAYTLNDLEKDVKTVRETIPFETVNFSNGAQDIAALPIGVYLGGENVCCGETNFNYGDFEEVDNAAALTFTTAEEISSTITLYEISGTRIIFKEVDQTSEYDAPLTYEFTGVEFTYDFSICGPTLTLSKGGNSLVLNAYCVTKNVESNLYLSGYSLPDSALIHELDYFVSSDTFNYAVTRDGNYYDISAFKFTSDGYFTVYLEIEDFDGNKDTFVKQYAYIMQSSSSSFLTDFTLVLLDGKTAYYYTDDITEREARALEDQGVDVGELSEEDLKAIAEKKSNLFDDLYNEFQEQGIDVTINRVNGEIAMDSSVLFGGDSAEITADGKALLNKFLAAYTAIIYNDKYDGFIAKTMIEGHTAPLANSTYESGLPLSEERANNVLAYCLSADTGVDISRLTETLEAVGMSNSKPIYDANGEVDLDACRRVSFRFIVNTEAE